MAIIIVALVGTAILALVVALFVVYGQILPAGLAASTELDEFGAFFGGVAGPLLSFISILLVVYTLKQQQAQTQAIYEENVKQDNLRYINKIGEDIDRFLSTSIVLDGQQIVELGNLVYGVESVFLGHEEESIKALNRLLKLTAHYCEAIAMYRENVNSYFVFKAHKLRAAELVEYLETQVEVLGGMSGPTLAICRSHLDG